MKLQDGSHTAQAENTISVCNHFQTSPTGKKPQMQIKIVPTSSNYRSQAPTASKSQ